MKWTAEVTNDPDDDYSLCIELLEHDEYRGRIRRRDGQLVLQVYSTDALLPVGWLRQVLAQAETDLV
jgi:hypothetical protein